ncbi:MAG: ABC transporter substrate-binding protein [Acidobacteriota bacterium]
MPEAPVAASLSWPESLFDGASNLTQGCVDDFDPTVDYFPEKANFRHTEQLEVEYHGHYKQVTFRPSSDPEHIQRYFLVQCGTPEPVDAAGAVVVSVPVRHFIATAASWPGVIDALGLVDQLAGLGTTRRLTTASIQERVERGEVTETGRFHHTDVEKILDLEAGLVVDTFSSYDDYEFKHLLEAVGAPVVLDGKHLEATPLATSEWIQWLALFFNRERDAEVLFQGIEERYQQLAQQVGTVENRPVVMTDWFDKDAWNVFGSANASARHIVDAGGAYFWEEDTPLNWFEVPLTLAFERAAEADHWVWVPSTLRNMDDVLSQEQRLASLPVVRNGELYGFDLGAPEADRAPFYDQLLTAPDVVLADMISIFHPDVLPDHEPVFFRRLEPGEAREVSSLSPRLRKKGES